MGEEFETINEMTFSLKCSISRDHSYLGIKINIKLWKQFLQKKKKRQAILFLGRKLFFCKKHTGSLEPCSLKLSKWCHHPWRHQFQAS